MANTSKPLLNSENAYFTEEISPFLPDSNLSDPVDSDAHFDLAILLEKEGTPSAIARAFHIYANLTKKQQHVEAMHRLGILYRSGVPSLFKPRLLEAMMMFELVLSKQPCNIQALEDLVDVVHHSFGRDERAKKLYREILKIDPNHAVAKVGLAKILGHDSSMARCLLMDVIEMKAGKQGKRTTDVEEKLIAESVELLGNFLHLDGHADEAEELLGSYGVEKNTVEAKRSDDQFIGTVGLCKRLRAVDLDGDLREDDTNKKDDIPTTGMDVT